MGSLERICLVPKLSGIGGMVSFSRKMAAGLIARGIDVCFDVNEPPYDALLVVGGTRQIHRLWQIKRHGIRVIQRLDGMNWIHRVNHTGRRHYLRSEYGNFMLSLIRSTLADGIVYQSEFSRRWWERVRGETRSPSDVIYNAVDLKEFTPGNNANYQGDALRVLVVEGSMLGGYEFGLQNAVYLAEELAHSHHENQNVELVIVGRVSSNTMMRWDNWLTKEGPSDSLSIQWMGTVSHDHIADIYRKSHLLFSADINAACPNSVIESMACGTPVVSFDTGSISELIAEKGGAVVPYGGDPWQLEPADIKSLAKIVVQVSENLSQYRESARQQAESNFDVERMIDRYLDVLVG